MLTLSLCYAAFLLSGCASTDPYSGFACGEAPIKSDSSRTGLDAILQGLINLGLGYEFDEGVVAAMDHCDIEFIGWYMSKLEDSPEDLTYFDKRKFKMLINE